MELKTFMSVENRIVTAQTNAPVISLVQDGLLGSYLLTLSDTRVAKHIFYDCVMALKWKDFDLQEYLKRAYKYYPDDITKKKMDKSFSYLLKEIVSGKLLYSLVFPKDFFYEKKTETDEEKPIVFIKEGIITKESGPLCKAVLGGKANAIHHLLFLEYSPSTSADFLSNAQFLVNKWLPTRGFSASVKDCFIDNPEEIQKTLRLAEIEVQEKIEINNPDTLEKEINNVLNSTTNVAMKLSKNGLRGGMKNGFVQMYKSGAKGSHLNVAQITAFVGQQNVKGQRIQKLMSNGRRAQSYFTEEDNAPNSRGFIDRCYMAGMDPQQVFFNFMGGREGLIDTAIKTAKSGYAQRKIVKKTEDQKVHFDGTVRGNKNNITQFLYGGDGYDVTKLYYTENKLFFVNPMRIAEKLNCSTEEEPILLSKSEIKTFCKTLKINEFDTINVNKTTKNIVQQLTSFLEKTSVAPSKKTEFFKIIKGKFDGAQIQGGEMVGIIASCSIGEPTTQGTLNSVDWNEEICVRRNSDMIVEPIGKFIDDLLEKNSDKVLQFPNEQEYLSIEGQGYKIVSCDENGKITWENLDAITRHLPSENMFKITLEDGRSVTVTQGESLLTQKNNKIVSMRGDEAKVGDVLPVVMKHPEPIYEKIKDIYEKYQVSYIDKLNDAGFVKISKIEKVQSSHSKVYDVTVKSTLNFVLLNGICVKDTFHFSGVSEKDVTLGVPRLEECLDATKNPKTPSCLIHLEDEFLKELSKNYNDENRKKSLEYIQKMRKEYMQTTLGTFMKNKPVMKKLRDDVKASPIEIFTHEEFVEPDYSKIYQILNPPPFECNDWVIEYDVDPEKLFNFNVTLSDICKSIEKNCKTFGRLYCIPSPMSCENLKIFIFIDFENSKNNLTKKSFDTGNDVQLINEENVNFYYTRDVVIKKLKDLKITGIDGIKKVFIKENIKDKEFVLDTQGCNFMEVLNSPSTNYSKTICDDFWQVYHCLGIEACRTILIEEFGKSMGESYVNPKHLQLLVDNMLCSGTITSVRREGIDKGVGPVAKASFEKSLENFAFASMFSEKEDVSSVSASITLGKLINGGTGFSTIHTDNGFVDGLYE